MKCVIEDCNKTFSVIYESDLSKEDRPVFLCKEHYDNMRYLVIDPSSAEENEDPVIGKRCSER